MSNSSRDAWQIVRDELLAELERELVPLAANARHAAETDAISLTFDELRERTRCPEYSTGLDFTSAGADTVRGLLYANRIEIARDYRLYFTSVYGISLKFTANPWLGMKWREEFELELSHTKAGVTEELWAIVERQVPESLRSVTTFFRRDAATRVKQIENIQRSHEHTFKRLESGETEKDLPGLKRKKRKED